MPQIAGGIKPAHFFQPVGIDHWIIDSIGLYRRIGDFKLHPGRQANAGDRQWQSCVTHRGQG
jgi:hypothetical protein